ncbi:hypothetical protein KM176_00270 [Pseudooceanicola sp. CBS1P-1]|uniref:Poly-beta-1,6-N-acetyl-D-glucosamine biosynthesis protein PgaD n=1 Tax=Pseudooceanicola albus TaxID=2692189 RepID=A0A6L7G2L4_9RHOB|nr:MULTISPECIES: hypothetical protein [Pseudooceanicola]MBT9382280.1 hypothetical protein [Pseudooceanicola endophyticus]MXN16823.1 hypothetical protein [Pseudooceanicola albus]
MSARRPPSWSEVLGLKPRQSLRNHPRTARLAGALILLLAALLGLSVLRVLVELLGQFGQALEGTGYAARDAQSEAVRNYGLALAAVIGVIFAIWRALVAQKQVHVAEQGLTTDRINKAVEGLGADKVVKRQRRSSGRTPLYEQLTLSEEGQLNEADKQVRLD